MSIAFFYQPFSARVMTVTVTMPTRLIVPSIMTLIAAMLIAGMLAVMANTALIVMIVMQWLH